MRKLSLIIINIFIVFSLGAQQELGLHFMRNVWQSNRTNPALFPKNKLTIGLPTAYNNIHITNITYNDLIRETEEGLRVVDANQAIAKLEDQNFIRENLELETVSLGLNFGKLKLSFHHMMRYNAYLKYPKALPQLIWQGNAQFIGETVSFGPDTQTFGYHEFAIGAAIELNKIITIGGRVKYLNGIADASTSNNRLELTTSDDIYQLSLDADFVTNTTGSISYNGFRDLDINFNFGRFDTDDLFTSNNGFAFDLGINLNLGKLEVAASVLDIGQIDWTENIINYSLKGKFEFEGLDIAQDLLSSDSTNFGSIIDTLDQIYDFAETANNYSTTLARRAYLSALYHLNDRLTLGGLLYVEDYRDETITAISIGANLKLSEMLSLGANYAFRNDTFDNLGVNATFNLGPLQIYTATDNLLTAFRLETSHSANIRLGVNLAF